MTHRNRLLNGASVVALLAGLSFYTHTADAAVITLGFDDVSDNGFGTAITNPYHGLTWTNWSILNTASFTTTFGPSGATPGTVSPPNVAYNPNGGEAIFTSPLASPFTLNSVDLTAFWNDGLQVTVTGKLNGVTEDTATRTLSATAPTLETFNFANINEVDLLVTASGTHHSGYSGAGTQVAMDNLTITTGTVTNTPEPSTLAILGAGLAGLGVVRRRRRKAG